MNQGKLIPTGIPQHPVETTDQDFDTLGLNESIVEAFLKIGFVNPTTIQAAIDSYDSPKAQTSVRNRLG